MSETIDTTSGAEKATAGATLATVVLLLLALLAFDPLKLVTSSASEHITLLFLALCSAVVAYSPLRRHFESAEAAAFVLTAAWFVIYALARRAGPGDGWTASLSNSPEITFKISYAARFAVAGAVTAAALNRVALSGFTRAALGVMLVVAVLLLGNYVYLSQFFQVGETEALDPVPVTQALLQLMEYASVAALCGVAAANGRTRAGLLKLLPVLLLALWARHQFGPVPVDEDQ